MNKFGAQNMVSSLKKVLMKKPQSFMSNIDLNKWNYISPLNLLESQQITINIK